MAEIIEFSHARTPSDKAGRATSDGQGTSSGQRSENQLITSSYFRAVKVFPSSSSRSKKRQSPAAKRPRVAKLTERDAQYVEAQAMRFERNSVSIAANNSRKIPTSQAKSVGKFRLAENSDSSDKSAMSSVNEVRQRIQHAFTKSGDSPITCALDWGFERNHIRDFLDGGKESLKPEVLQLISEQYGIPFNMLIIKRQRKKRKSAA